MKSILKGVLCLSFLLVLSSCGKSEEQLVEEGRNLMGQESYAEAIKSFNKALDKNSNNYVALNAKGVALLRIDESVTTFNQAIRIDSTDYRAYYNRSNTRRLLSDDQGAMLDLDRAILLQPNVADLYINRGAILFKYGEFDRALFDFEFALRFEANNPLVYLNKGKAELRINNSDDAIFDFKKAIELNQEYGEAYYWLGLAELALENRTDGCSYLTTAQSLNFEGATEAISQNCMQ